MRFEKFIEKLNLDKAEKEAVEDLEHLGLNFDDLKNKLTLDIGAGPAFVAEAE